MDRLPSLSPNAEPDPPVTPPPARRRRGGLLTAALIPAIVGGVVAFGVARMTDDSSTTTVTVAASTDASGPTPTATVPAPSGDGLIDIPAIVRATQNGVVLVETGSGLGTGFLIDQKGHILTNAHVVDTATTVDVTFNDGTIERAKVLAADTTIDLAVLALASTPASAKVLQLGTSKSLRVGEPVVAIGNPLGQDSSVTSGIVSATKRTICSPTQDFIGNAIQTDAAINPGNSGGPLLNAAGQVVGINSQILSQGGGNEGIGFAVAIDIIKPVANGIIAGGKPKHAWIGVEGTPLDPQTAKDLGMPGTTGVVLRSINPNGPAKAAGLIGSPAAATAPPKGGDVIVAINDQPISDFGDLTQEVSSRTVGDVINMTVLRDGKRLTVKVTLADRPANLGGGRCRG
jgi:S1-C subfamily serine protease